MRKKWTSQSNAHLRNRRTCVLVAAVLAVALIITIGQHFQHENQLHKGRDPHMVVAHAA